MADDGSLDLPDDDAIGTNFEEDTVKVIKALDERCTELEKRVNQLSSAGIANEAVTNISAKIKNLNTRMDESDERMKKQKTDLEKKIKDLSTAAPAAAGGTDVVKTINNVKVEMGKMIDNVKAEFQTNLYEKTTSQTQIFNNKIKYVETDIDELREKIKSLSAPPAAGGVADDVAGELRKELEELKLELKTEVELNKSDIKALNKNIQEGVEGIETLTNSLGALEAEFKSIQNTTIHNIKEEVERLKEEFKEYHSANSGSSSAPHEEDDEIQPVDLPADMAQRLERLQRRVNDVTTTFVNMQEGFYR